MKKNRLLRTLPFNLVGFFFAAIALFPLLWMLIAGFKSNAEVLAMPFSFFPGQWHPENYGMLLTNQYPSYVFTNGGSFVRSMVMTFSVAAFALVFSLLLNSMAGYVFARLDIPFKRLLWGVYLLPWFIPSIAVQISTFETVVNLNMIDTFWVLTLPGICYTYSIFFYRQFYLNVPPALEEAARIDGDSRLGIYAHIFLPMSATPFVVMGISVFLGFWNSYLWPALTINDVRMFQINQVIAYFRSSHSSQQHMVMAATTLAAAPTIILFMCFQRYIMGGIKVSGLK